MYMTWVELEAIRYLEGTLMRVGEWRGEKCFLVPAVGEGGPAWALIMVAVTETLLALWYSPGEPDYVADHDGDDAELTKLITEAADAIQW